MTLRRGDVFRHELAGAGGWGDPLERDPAAVLADVRNEVVTRGRAQDDYGVVIDTETWTIDHPATEAQRARMRTTRGWRETPSVSRGAATNPPAASR